MKRHGFVLAVLLVLIAAIPAVAAETPEPGTDAVRRACSLRTLQGTYGYYGTGTVIPNSLGMPPGPTVSLGIAKFDGYGGFTWTTTDVPGLTLTGSYQLEPDCTGTALFFFDPFPPAPGNVVVVDGGSEIFIAPPPGGPMVSMYVYKRQ